VELKKIQWVEHLLIEASVRIDALGKGNAAQDEQGGMIRASLVTNSPLSI
jgi:hypothetical protein